MDKFDEYKFFSERVQNRSERRQNTSQIYLTVNTGIVGVAALLIKDSGLHGWNLIFAIMPLFIVGIIVCIIWRKMLLEFKRIIGWQYEQLREMEKDIKGCYRVYNKEWEWFFSSKSTKKSFSFSDLEAWMPLLFIALYLVYSIGMISFVSLKLI